MVGENKKAGGFEMYFAFLLSPSKRTAAFGDLGCTNSTEKMSLIATESMVGVRQAHEKGGKSQNHD